MTTILIETKDVSTALGRIPMIFRAELIKFIKATYPGNASVILFVDECGVEVFESGGVGLVFLQDDEDIPEHSYTLPLLYAMDKKGKERVWKIWAVEDTVYKSYGEVGGLKVPSSRTYKGVNIGKANETTAEEQAKREAERDWVKQLDKGYSPKPGKGDDISKRILDAKKRQGNINVNISALIRGIESDTSEQKVTTKAKAKSLKVDNGVIPDFESPILPMHCQTWSNEAKVLKYFDFENGVYIQPKLDGIRCLVQFTDYEDEQKIVLLSRKGKQFVWLSHLREEAARFLEGYKDIILDCEVYAETIIGKLAPGKKKNYTYSPDDPELLMEQRFDVISGAVRPVRKEPHPLEDQLCLHIFDIADPTGELDQDQRFEVVKKLFARKDISKRCPHIKRVETKSIDYPEEIEDYHDETAAKGYEGVVVRARDLMYESDGRSMSMRKYKQFEEREFPIIDIQCDEGVDREHFQWVCEKIIKNEDGTTELKSFNVKPMGTREQKWEWYDHSDKFLGKQLTVKYQKKKKTTGDDSEEEERDVPRFPIGKAIRDYE